jgi:hypothetical protein
MTTRITTPRQTGYVEKYITADGRRHRFAAVDLKHRGPNVTYVPYCRRDWKYPDKRFFAGELHDASQVSREHRCPYCYR